MDSTTYEDFETVSLDRWEGSDTWIDALRPSSSFPPPATERMPELWFSPES